ncbi:MAG: hypothetical protein EOM92_01005 [Gammaproteobacteria bacterium]|nr:hypothetical protein [Gammaproteobacteria bacterium]
MPQSPAVPPPDVAPDLAGQAASPIHFFRNYNRAIALAYGGILLGLLVFFGYQLRLKLDDQIGLIQASFQRYSQFIEFVIRSSTDHLETLRMLVQDEGQGGGVGAPPPDLSAFTLKMEGERTRFSLDDAQDWDMTGNLVGLGPLEGRSAYFYRDLNLALVLNDGFRSLAFTLPNAVRARFISHQDFVLSSPWRASATQPFSRSVYLEPVWELGLPNRNPDREKYWAPIYFSGPQQGLLIPVAVPVYRDDRFVGVIAIDTSLDYLNRINADFGYPLGTAYLADALDRVLAHTGLYANPLTVEEAPPLADALPSGLRSRLDALAALPLDVPTDLDGHLVMRHRFISAPWTLTYTVPRAELWGKVLADYGPAMLAMLVGLTAVMAVTYLVTSREFVGPAAKLVQHLAAEARFQPPTKIPLVPSAWRPWFNAVTKAFRESIQLMALRQELDVAARMQLAMLPHAWPVHTTYGLWGTMRPAKEVGGDFYDHFELADGQRGMVVADVSGKGIGPGLFGMMAKTLLRARATQGSLDLAQVIEQVNDELSADNDSCIFVTLFYGLFDPATGMLRFVNAGHPPPLLVHADGQEEYLPVLGGIAPGILSGAVYPQGEVPLQPGDTLIIYSDGVTEAMNAANQEFGMERLAAAFRGQPPVSPTEAVERTLTAVQTFVAGYEQSDDITCVALGFHPGDLASSQREMRT